jgi:hypothetical protein
MGFRIIGQPSRHLSAIRELVLKNWIDGATLIIARKGHNMTQPTFWQSIRLWWGFHKITQHYRDLGSPCPELEAQEELYWRARLEHLRDYASAEYIKTGRHLPDIKQDWMDENIKPLAKFTDYKQIIAIRRVVKEMLYDELLHPEALSLWERWLATHQRKIMREHLAENPSGYTPLETRVLLGK